jgi:hypothetical protein
LVENELDVRSVPYTPPYTFNWSLPETFSFSAKPGDYIYVAAWSDHAAAQGLIGQFTINGQTILTNTSEWQVTFTGINLGDFSPAPTDAELLAQFALANWQTVGYSLPQGSAPWSFYQPGGLIRPERHQPRLVCRYSRRDPAYAVVQRP